MLLPRLTNIYTVRILTKGGGEITHAFYQFEFKGNSEEVTNLKWASADRKPFYIAISEIAAIQVLSRKARIRIRHAKD